MAKSIELDRRTFLEGVGVAILTFQCLPLIAHASGSPTRIGKDTADDLIIQSSPGLFDHVHDLLIPSAVLKTPPLEGVELTSTQTRFHRHDITLTHEQLTRVREGGTVTMKASSHLFVIALAVRQDAVQFGSGMFPSRRA